jgi:hypothetical protein
LRNADRDPGSFILHIDATYKLSQVGYLVVVVGVSDRSRQFHLVAVFVVSQETQEQYTELLSSLRRVYELVTGKELCVQFAMGDADLAQWAALQNAFGKTDLLDHSNRMCSRVNMHRGCKFTRPDAH